MATEIDHELSVGTRTPRLTAEAALELAVDQRLKRGSVVMSSQLA